MDTTRRYVFSFGTRVLIIVGIVFFSIMVLGGLLSVWFSDKPIHENMGFILNLLIGCILPGLFIRWYLGMRDSVLVTEQALIYESANGSSITVPWEQIVGLVPHSLRRRYDVLDSQGHCRMHISYELENFLELDATLREHLQKSSFNGRTTWFVKSSGTQFIVAVSAGLFALSMLVLWRRGIEFGAVILAALSIVGMVWGFYFQIETVTVSEEGILLDYWKRKTTIPYATIKNLNLQDDYIPGTWKFICVERPGHKQMKIKWEYAEATSLYQAMETAWKGAVSSSQKEG
jgi:hypothetical protein